MKLDFDVKKNNKKTAVYVKSWFEELFYFNIDVVFFQSPQNFPHAPQRASHVYYRNTVIAQLQSNHSIVMLVATNLSNYMKKARELARGM